MFRVLLIIIFLFSVKVNSFSQQFTINFENNNNTLIKIDTSNLSNIWQIGKPQKVIFDSAYSKPNAIVTDTINFYPPNNISSFTLKIFDSNMFGWDIWVSLKHKYDTDSLMDGGYVEISIDGGNTWNNIINVSNLSEDLYYSNDTIAGGIPALSGKSNWDSSSIIICGFSVNPSDSAFLRFVFKSDSVSTNKDGWMIDNIEIWYVADACGGVYELMGKNNFITIAPNPFIDESLFEFTNPDDELTEVEIYNSIGEKISEFKNISGNKLQLNRNTLSGALYFYKAKTKNGYTESGRFVVQ